MDVLLSNPLYIVIIAVIFVFLFYNALQLDKKENLLIDKAFKEEGFKEVIEVNFFRAIAWEDYSILKKPLSHIVEALAMYKGMRCELPVIIFLFSRGHMHDNRDKRKTKWMIYAELKSDIPDFYLSTGIGIENMMSDIVGGQTVYLPHSPDFSTAFKLFSAEPGRVKSLFDAELVNLICSHAVADIEAVNGNLLIECDARFHNKRDVQQALELSSIFVSAFNSRAPVAS